MRPRAVYRSCDKAPRLRPKYAPDDACQDWLLASRLGLVARPHPQIHPLSESAILLCNTRLLYYSRVEVRLSVHSLSLCIPQSVNIYLHVIMQLSTPLHQSYNVLSSRHALLLPSPLHKQLHIACIEC